MGKNDKDKDIWERMEEETYDSFSGFVAYRNIEPKQRTLANGVRFLYPELDEKSDEFRAKVSQFTNWSSRYEWVRRAKAYDGHIDNIRTNVRMERIKQAEEDILNMSEKMKQIANAALDHLLLDVSRLSPSLLLQYIKSALDLEASALGIGRSNMGGENQGTTVNVHTGNTFAYLPKANDLPDNFLLEMANQTGIIIPNRLGDSLEEVEEVESEFLPLDPSQDS